MYLDILFYGLLSFSIVIAYSLFAKVMGWTSYKRKFVFFDIIKYILFIGGALSIAIPEEYLFRHIIMGKFMIETLHINITDAVIFSSLYLFVPLHFWLGIHKKALHRINLFIGLFLFSLICSKLYIDKSLAISIFWHAGAILGVMITDQYFKGEKRRDWAFYDESHALLRCPLIWAILSIVYILL